MTAEAIRGGARGAVAAMAMTGMRRVTTGLGLLERTPPDALARDAPSSRVSSAGSVRTPGRR